MNLNEMIDTLDPREKIKVNLENGAYFSGQAKRIKKKFSNYLDEDVKKVETHFISRPFRFNLCKQINIFI